MFKMLIFHLKLIRAFEFRLIYAFFAFRFYTKKGKLAVAYLLFLYSLKQSNCRNFCLAALEMLIVAAPRVDNN